MSNKPADFNAYKKLWAPDVIHVGDTVEWLDFDGSLNQGIVDAIQFRSVDGFSFRKTLPSMPLWEKDDYVIHFNNGITIVGEVLSRKIIRKAADLKFISANGSHKYAD